MKQNHGRNVFWGIMIILAVVGLIQLRSGDRQISDNQVILTASCKCPVARQDQTLEDITDLMAEQSGHWVIQQDNGQFGQTGGNKSGSPAKSWDHRVV